VTEKTYTILLSLSFGDGRNIGDATRSSGSGDEKGERRRGSIVEHRLVSLAFKADLKIANRKRS